MSRRKEIWKPIWGYTGWYEVSNMGRVRSLDRKIVRSASPRSIRYPKKAYTFVAKGKILKPTRRGRDRYAEVGLHKFGKTTIFFVHTLVSRAFEGPLRKNFVVHHINHRKRDNRATNLKQVSESENKLHSDRNQRRLGKKRRSRVLVKPSGTWLNIPGFRGIYEISNKGQVWSNRKGFGKLPCLLWGCVTIRGYKSVVLWKDGKSRGHQIHRLVVETFERRLKRGEVVHHINGNKLDNRPDNLQIVTCAENSRFAGKSMSKGKGVDEALVRKALFLLLPGDRSIDDVAKMVGRGASAARDWLKGKTALSRSVLAALTREQRESLIQNYVGMRRPKRAAARRRKQK